MSKHKRKRQRSARPTLSARPEPTLVAPAVRQDPRQDSFYEALPQLSAAPIVPALPTIYVPDPGQLLRQGATEAARYAQTGWTALLQYSRAAAIDAGHYGAVGWRVVTARTARRAYLALIITGSLAIAAGVAVVGSQTLSAYANDLTSPAALMSKKDTGITLLDRNGQVLYRAYGATTRAAVPADQVPQALTKATLAAEDPQFYDHPGFSWQATGRAIYVDLAKRGKVEGGSTITQQLVKNALLTSQKTFERKFQEILLSIELERRYSKTEILNTYLNEVYYGEGAYGLGAAAQTYFHKTPAQLTLGENALLAGLPLGPSRFDPVMHPEDAAARRNYVLDRMLSLGHITSEEAATAKAEPIVAYPQQVTIRAPHFVFYVLDQLRTQYGDEAVEQGGMTVVTSLDLSKQDKAQTIVSDQINRLSYNHVTNGGLVSLDPTSGDILAMVGSVDYNAPGFGNVNVTLSELQPGSSFKPLAYVTAFKKGWTGATHVDDKPLSIPSGDGSIYTPQNYDGKFRGSVSLRRALANSLNIPAIKVVQFAGITDTIQTAHDLGITSLNQPERYGVSLVLGGAEVKPLEMAAAYGGFATGGRKVTPRSILEVRDRTGKTTRTAGTPDPMRVLDERYAYMITSILSDNTARTEEFGPNSPLRLSRPAAAKTGTTNDFRDNWTVGYTPGLVTAVWVGNNDHTAMNGVDGITGAAPIWHNYMEAALAGTPVQAFTPPAGIVTIRTCVADGGQIEGNGGGIEEVFPSDNLPKRCAAPTPTPTPTPSASPAPGTDPDPVHAAQAAANAAYQEAYDRARAAARLLHRGE